MVTSHYDGRQLRRFQLESDRLFSIEFSGQVFSLINFNLIGCSDLHLETTVRFEMQNSLHKAEKMIKLTSQLGTGFLLDTQTILQV